MQFSDLPPEIIQIIIDSLPLDWLGYLKNSPEWISHFAFRAYYRNISHFPRYQARSPPEGDPCYYNILDESKSPFELDFEKFVNFWNFDELRSFFHTHPHFSPSQIAFENADSLIRFNNLYKGVVESAERVIICTLHPIPDNEMISLRKVPHLIYRAWWTKRPDEDLFPVEDETYLESFRDVIDKVGLVEVDCIPTPRGHFRSLSFEAGVLNGDEIHKVELPEFLTYIELKTWMGNDSVKKLKLESANHVKHISFKDGYFDGFDSIELPKGLKTLQLRNCSMLGFTHFDAFDYLNTLIIEYGSSPKFCYDCFINTVLPNSLKKLVVRIDPYLYRIDEEFIPQHQEFFDHEKRFIVDYRVKLPKKLVEFHLDGYGYIAINHTWKMPDIISRLVLLNIPKIANFEKLHLPLHLKVFFFESLDLISLEGIQFPENCEVLATRNAYLSKEAFHTCNLLKLRKLKTLSLSNEQSCLGYLHDWLLSEADFSHLTAIRRINLSGIKSSAGFAMKVPNELEDLTIVETSINSISPSFEFPIYLRNFRVACFHLNSNILNNLPCCLENLSVHAAHAEPLHESFKNFYRLRNVELDFPIDNTSFANMHLERFQGISNLTLHTAMTHLDTSQLPPSLINLRLSAPLTSIDGDFQRLKNLRCLGLWYCNPGRIYENRGCLLSLSPSLAVLALEKCEGYRFNLVEWTTSLNWLGVDFFEKPCIDDIVEMCEFYVRYKKTYIDLNFKDPRLEVYDRRWVQSHNKVKKCE
ncbi:uncharacterized protein J8A68_003254 [[Candida] subhashii]|uniref:Uncharacterized protein n=1 Tax=[Candida] subhashii TaxID=561895 RepID=A0A8J5QA19_9ASCO|nr:uncharacterized protein J8A68_003254 [[Candida] subhashii]KAG7663254.1 hypothetical protein J8A68_003254 [[Candida] subhashii]